MGHTPLGNRNLSFVFSITRRLLAILPCGPKMAASFSSMDTDLYEHQGKAITNFKEQLPIPQGELAQELTKDPYNFDFLTLTPDYKEQKLEEELKKKS